MNVGASSTQIRLRNSTGRDVVQGEVLGIGKKLLYGKMGRAVELKDAMPGVSVIAIESLKKNKTGRFHCLFRDQ